MKPPCPRCDHTRHPTVVAGSRFLPGAFLYRPADADGPLFATREEAEEWVCARRRKAVVERESARLVRASGADLWENVPTNQDGPGGLLRQQPTGVPGPRRTAKEFD